jgi:cob(I)alamin adenosyltransferase
MRIYTKTGDLGETGLFGGARVKKNVPRVEAYGTVDELNATLGLVRSARPTPFTDETLAKVQVDLFTLGAELATVPGKEESLKMHLLDAGDYERLERAIDDAEKPLAELKTFILPGGTESASRLHLARTVCRRAERALLSMDDVSPRGDLVIYLNRLSDLLFTLARYENHAAKVEDVPWAPHAR